MAGESVFARELGNLFKARRKGLNLKQASVAARVGIGQPKYSQIETGRQLPDEREAVEIARVLRIPLEDVFERGGYSRQSRLDTSSVYSSLYQVFSDADYEQLMVPPGETPLELVANAWRAYRDFRQAAQGGRWPEALTHANLSLEQLQAASNWLASYFLDAQGLARLQQGDLFGAEVSYRELGERIGRVPDRVIWGRRYFHEGELARRKGNWRESLEAYRRAIAEFDALPDRDLAEHQHTTILRKIAIVYLQQGLWEEARPPLQAAEGQPHVDSNLYERAKLAMARGWLELYAGNIERSIDLRRAAVTAAEDYHGPHGDRLRGQAHLYLALSLRERGSERDRELALRHLLSAEGHAAQAGHVEPTIALGRAQIELDQKLWDDRAALDWATIHTHIQAAATLTAADRLQEGYAHLLRGVTALEWARADHRLSADDLRPGFEAVDQALRHFARREHAGYLAEAHYFKAYYLMVVARHDEGLLNRANDVLDAAERIVQRSRFPLLQPRIQALRRALQVHLVPEDRQPGIHLPNVEALAAQFEPDSLGARYEESLTWKHVGRLKQLAVGNLLRRR